MRTNKASTPSSQVINCILGIAVRPDNKLLLTQRHQPKNTTVHHKWQFPGGGQEFGETFEDTLFRELHEEIGIIPRVLFPHPLTHISIWEKGEAGHTHHRTQVNLMVYLVDIGNQRIQLDNNTEKETETYAWYSLEEITSLPTLPGVTQLAHSAFQLIAHQNLLSHTESV